MRAGWLVALGVLCSACGRYRFDPLGGDDDDGMTDGDGSVGDGPPFADGTNVGCTPVEKRVSQLPFSSPSGAFAWTGSEFGFLWGENDTAVFARTGPDGTVIGTLQNLGAITSGSVAIDGDLVWSGGEWDAIWENGGTMQFTRIDASGAEIGTEVPVSSSAYHADLDLVVTGGGFASNWYDLTYKEYIAIMNPLGGNTSGDQAQTGTGQSYISSLAWTGNELALLYQHVNTGPGTTEFDFQRVSGSAASIGAPRKVNEVSSPQSDMVWNGTNFAIVWSDTRDGNPEIYVETIDTSGVELNTVRRITNDPGASQSPSLVWTGSEYGLVWQDDRGGNIDLYFRRLSSFGVPIAPEQRLTTNPSRSQGPAVTWTGGWYAVAFSDDRDGQDEVYFLTICQ